MLTKDPVRFIVDEFSFFNYRNQLGAEKDYLLRDAMPDWRQKAAQVTIALDKNSDVSFQQLDKQITVSEWWNMVQSIVSSWAQQGEEISIPEPEAMLQELQSHFPHHANLSSDKALGAAIGLPTVANSVPKPLASA